VKLQGLDTWNPRRLPPVKDPNRIPRSGSLFEIAAIVIFNVWFISVFWPGPVVDLYGIQVALAPVWQVLFWSFLVLAAINVASATVNLFRPYWTKSRAVLRLLSDTVGGGLFCWLLKSQVLTGISAPGMAPSKAIKVTSLINLLMARMLPWAIVVLVVILCLNAYRILRLTCVHSNGSIGPAAKGLPNPTVSGSQ